VDWRGRGWAAILDLGYLVRKTEIRFDPEIGDELQIAAGVRIPILRDRLAGLLTNRTRLLSDHLADIGGAWGNTTRAGLRLRVAGGLVLAAAGGAGFGDLTGTALWEAMIQVAWEQDARN